MAEMPDFNEVFSDDHLLVINKAPGVVFHSNDHEKGIVEQVRQHYGSKVLYPVHRLDRMTSGLLVFARNAEVNRAMSELLREKKLEKYYLALVPRSVKKKQGAIVGDMQKSRQGSWKLTRSHENPAVTYFKTRAIDEPGFPGRLAILKPETGKTHQLRVAMKSIGAPIVGDQRYGGIKADQGYLHAWKMRFDLAGQRYQISCLPDSGEFFESALLDSFLEVVGEPECLDWPKGAYLLPPISKFSE